MGEYIVCIQVIPRNHINDPVDYVDFKFFLRLISHSNAMGDATCGVPATSEVVINVTPHGMANHRSVRPQRVNIYIMLEMRAKQHLGERL